MDRTIDLQVVISAVDEASSKLASIGKSATALGKQFTIAGTIITGALALAVKSASDAQVQIAKVDATLATMGDTGKSARAGILQAADATLKLGFDNEDAAVSISNLFQRTGDLIQAIKLNRLAMDLARAKNIDLATASNLVNMALSGNAKLLKQYGIVIEDTATPLEALGILQEKVGGQAEAFGQTFAGASEALKQQFGELVELVGAQLLPILTQVVTQVTPLISKVIEWAQAHPNLTQSIVLTVGAVGALLAVLGPVLLLIGSISAPMLIAIAVIAVLVAGIFQLIKHWDSVKTALAPVIEQVKLFASLAMEFLRPAIDLLVFALKLLWEQLKFLWDLIAPILLPTLKILAGFFGATLVGAIAILIGSIGAIALVIAGFVEGLKILIETLSNIALWFMVTLPEALGVLGKKWTESWNNMKTAFQAVADFILSKVDAVINAWNRAQALVSAPISAVSRGVSSVVSSVGSFISGKRAEGGPVDAGKSYLVGERGAEVFTPNASGSIMANGGGGINITITGNTFMSDERSAIAIGDMIVNRLKMVAKLRV